MLELKKITKIYETEGFKQKALDEISINFRECEFASILGPSGSGKTTLLNIIGGLDHYTSGDLIINETSTKKFKDSNWDSYRNHRIGFVFQNYNLITHQTILANVTLALTLSGISKKEAIKKAKDALSQVGLTKHINKKPNQLSGGQMQRVAIARALVNDPDILLADEPTGALDSETSVQIMETLKKIAKNKLVIMVTHNPELAEQYSNRIITLKDGKIISDTNSYDGKVNTKMQLEINSQKSKKTSMSFFTALSLSFNNLLTKKGRTVLIALAGSIGIIGIALIMALSNGFQNYIDQIQEDTLSSYPLSIMQESTDIAGALLSMTSGSKTNDGSETVVEKQYISTMLDNIKVNDLKSFKNYYELNNKKVKDDISSVKYTYSIDPIIYTVDATKNLAKVNPSNLFNSLYGSSMLSSYSSFASVYSQMIDDSKELSASYDVLKGTWPKAYNEMVIVLSQPNNISDLLVYSLGLRDTNELTSLVSGIMSGESVELNNEPLTITYDDLMKIELKLINPSDLYQYNSKYKVYEDMSTNDAYMKKLYNNAEALKIVGIVCPKEGTTSMALNPGVAYTSGLIEHIIDYAKNQDIVKKQIADETVDIFSGAKFESQKDFNFKFADLVTVDNQKLQSAFKVNLDQKEVSKATEEYMNNISKSISLDTTTAKKDLLDLLTTLENDMTNTISTPLEKENISDLVNDYIENTSYLDELVNKYGVNKSDLRDLYKGLLINFWDLYVETYKDNGLTININNPIAVINSNNVDENKSFYNESVVVSAAIESMAKDMTENSIKQKVLYNVSGLSSYLSTKFAKSLNVDSSIITSAFKINLTDEEISRVMSAMLNNKEASANTNLISLGYQDIDNPTYISFYFNSFDGKEDFLTFIDNYNKEMKDTDNEDKVINYQDTTGILMGSVKTIVNAVSYVLIAFVSISLVVSSIMIGVITYISVYERTKEIGILRAIGASKKNISSIFNAETFIIGLLSGVIAMLISYSLIPIINMIIHHFTGNIPLNAVLNISQAFILMGLSILLTLIGGFIPAKKASTKDPVEALRCE